tara:strand:+ start:2772 stop:2945 length:174 start_codon:yes stop_codon:yes gene_type:complete
MQYIIRKIKELPRFEGSHCPNESNHEYVKRIDTGRYVLLEDVIRVLKDSKDERGYYK